MKQFIRLLTFLFVITINHVLLAQTKADEKLEQMSLSETQTFTERYSKNTFNVIKTAQKLELFKGIDEKSLTLSNAMRLQDYSLLLFKAGKYEEALLCNYRSRELAISIIHKLLSESSAQNYYRFANEPEGLLEKYRKNDTSTLQEWLNLVKINE